MSKQASEIKPVLFVVTSTAVKGATGLATGYNLGEVVHPLEKLQDAGIQVDFASIQGGDAPMDGLQDLNDAVIAHYWTDTDFRYAIAHTARLADVDTSLYSAIFFAGGHGTMWDFPENTAVQQAIRDISSKLSVSQHLLMQKRKKFNQRMLCPFYLHLPSMHVVHNTLIHQIGQITSLWMVA